MKISKDSKQIFAVILASLIARLVFFFSYHPVWWDSAVYLSMGKYIFSFGKVGFWEYTRPVLWPMILGFFWKMGLNAVIVGRFLELFFSLGITYLTYLIANEIFNKKIALVSSLILSFSPTFFFFGYRLYTSIPSTFLALLAVYLFIKLKGNKKVIIPSFLLALSFLTRFPQGIFFFIILLLLALFYDKKKGLKSIKELSIFVSIFLIALLPYLVFSYIKYKNPLFLIIEAKDIMSYAGFVFIKPWHYYFLAIPKENPLYIFSVFGLFLLFKDIRKKRDYLLVILAAVLPFAYFTTLPHKELRFSILFLPYLAILASFGITSLFQKIKSCKKLFLVAVAALFLFSVFNSFYQYALLEPKKESWLSKEYYRYLENKEVEGNVLITDPLVSLYLNKAPELMYYPAWGTEKAAYYIDYIQKNKENISYIFFDTCEGGTLCPPYDMECPAKKAELIDKSKELFNLKYYKNTGRCEYFIFG